MTALASSLRRMWPAKSRSPRLTGRGRSGSISTKEISAPENGFATWVRDKFLELAEITQRTTPTLIVIALRILR